jgi:hypothetical protein
MTSTRIGWALGCAVLPFLVACGADDSTGKSSSPHQDAPAVEGTDGWKDLLSGDWTMPPGSEGYVCVRKTVDEDLYVDGFEAINPLGTHHTLLTMGEPNAPDGVTDCNAGDNRTLSAFGSGVGTNPLNFPEGVALRIPAGTQLLLNLHLFNVDTEDLTGTSGTRIHTIAEADVVHVAEGILAGTIAISIPPTETKTTIGYCTMSEDFTLFAVAPHMHTLGIHETVTAEPESGAPTVLLDQPYDFNEQTYNLIDPIAVSKGDRLQIDCTHHNTTSKTVTFGESTLSEMCFAGVYRYPAAGGFFICADPPE